MNRKETNRGRTRRYLQFLNFVSECLYEEDPGGMGISVHAPRDEYIDSAEHLVADLYRCRTRAAAAKLIRYSFPDATDRLVDRLWELASVYRRLG
jgi:hypothetical protein